MMKMEHPLSEFFQNTEIENFYTIILKSAAGRIEPLSGPHPACGPQFPHHWVRLCYISTNSDNTRLTNGFSLTPQSKERPSPIRLSRDSQTVNEVFDTSPLTNFRHVPFNQLSTCFLQTVLSKSDQVCRFHPFIDHEGPQGQQRYSSTLFQTSALEGGEGSASRPGSTLPPGNTRYPLYRRLGGPQGRSEQVWKISPTPGFDPRTVQPVGSRYTDYATRPTPNRTKMQKIHKKKLIHALTYSTLFDARIFTEMPAAERHHVTVHTEFHPNWSGNTEIIGRNAPIYVKNQASSTIHCREFPHRIS